MKFSLFIMMVLTLLMTWRDGVRTQSIRSVKLSKIFCAKLTDISLSVVFTPMDDLMECTKLYLELASSSGVSLLVVVETNSTLSCGVSSEFPDESACDSTSSTVKIYVPADVKTCLDPCSSSYTLQGKFYGLRQTFVALNYTDNIKYCSSIGGKLAEGDTMAEIQKIRDATSASIFSIGGNDLAEQNVYRWHRGDLLDPSVWLGNEPSSRNERCLGIQTRNGVYGVIDVTCDRLMRAVCSIQCA